MLFKEKLKLIYNKEIKSNPHSRIQDTKWVKGVVADSCCDEYQDERKDFFSVIDNINLFECFSSCTDVNAEISRVWANKPKFVDGGYYLNIIETILYVLGNKFDSSDLGSHQQRSYYQPTNNNDNTFEDLKFQSLELEKLIFAYIQQLKEQHFYTDYAKFKNKTVSSQNAKQTNRCSRQKSITDVYANTLIELAKKEDEILIALRIGQYETELSAQVLANLQKLTIFAQILMKGMIADFEISRKTFGEARKRQMAEAENHKYDNYYYNKLKQNLNKENDIFWDSIEEQLNRFREFLSEKLDTVAK
ncbi:MAG: hypothetical protein LBI42_05195 [Chitinispirillales bacterium]|jgi:hypothetical protein|nr:hypothetical protein [Chitinispirillales bacterium]